MGNLWTPEFDSSSGSSFSSTKPSSSGIVRNTSNEGRHSGTGSTHSRRLDEVFPDRQILPTPNLWASELYAATSIFSPDTVIGEGHCGTVFKVWIDKKTFAPTEAGYGMAVAVKKWNSADLWGRDECRTEVNFLGSLSHPNIVRLLGHCGEYNEPLLVYEFMPRGSLANHLFSSSTFQSLSWRIRLKIAIGVARGLAFLHCSERKIIHRNLTPYNVLIDSNYNAKISGFGRARICPPQGENSHASTGVTGHLYVKSDVYLFGVVLLEMLSGMRAFDANRPSEQQNLVKWAEPYLSDQTELSQVMDRRLEGQYPFKGALQAAKLILECLRSKPRNRPSMTQVLEELELIRAIRHDDYWKYWFF